MDDADASIIFDSLKARYPSADAAECAILWRLADSIATKATPADIAAIMRLLPPPAADPSNPELPSWVRKLTDPQFALLEALAECGHALGQNPQAEWSETHQRVERAVLAYPLVTCGHLTLAKYVEAMKGVARNELWEARERIEDSVAKRRRKSA